MRLTVALPKDSAAKLQEYAHPEMIVTTDWVAESDEDVLLYETGHIPGAVKLDWHTELNDAVTRDYVDGPGFARLMSDKGISRDTTLVLYGDRAKWIAEGRPLSTEEPKRPQTDYPVVDRDDSQIRAFRDQVVAHLGQPL